MLAAIAECGAAETTIDRVTAASGISRGTVYAYFPGGREELLRAAYARLGERLVARARAAEERAEGWLDRVCAHAGVLYTLADDAWLGEFYNVSGPALITDGAERGIGSGAGAAMIREALEAARAAGEVDPGVDPAESAVLLVGALRESAIRVARGSAPERAESAFRRLAAGLAAAR